MVEVTHRKAFLPFTLLSLSVGAYFLVLSGSIPFGQNAGVFLTIIAGAATLSAISIREKLPAITAGVATLGFSLGVTMSGFVVAVAAALAILGSAGFLVSTAYTVGADAYRTPPP